MAKQAAAEAREMDPDDLQSVTTLADVKRAARESGAIKWQERWDRSETGRHLYLYRPQVGFKIIHTFAQKSTDRIIGQLRTGYVQLQDYLHKIGLSENDKCYCGEKETVSHYLLDFPLYEEDREVMTAIFFLI